MSDETTPYAALPPAGWYPDPGLPGQSRWWDGRRWQTPARVPVRRLAASGWGVAVITLLVIDLVAMLISTAVEGALVAGPTVLDGAGGGFALALIGLAMVVGMLGTPVMVATVVVWCFWQVRVLSLVGATGFRSRVGWHIAGWLIPVGNLVIPLWNMHGLWRSAGLRGQWVLWFWWSAILVYWAAVLGTPAVGAVAGVGTGWVGEVSLAATVVAGGLAVVIVRRLSSAADSLSGTTD